MKLVKHWFYFFHKKYRTEEKEVNDKIAKKAKKDLVDVIELSNLPVDKKIFNDFLLKINEARKIIHINE